jgi:transmembrane sensor
MRPAWLAAAAAIAMSAAVWFKPWWSAPSDFAPATVAHIEPSLLRLPDGSVVEVNAGGEVTEHFTAQERRVRLVRGEAHFTVAKIAARPFIVEANGVAARAIGTAFNVRFRPDATVEILVTEGTVQVVAPVLAPHAGSPPAQLSLPASPAPALLEEGVPLTAGQRTIVSTLASARPIKRVVETLAAFEIERALAWQTGRLVLDATPLAEVVERINRHAASRKELPRLTVADPRLREMKFSGRIRPQNIESFVEMLETNFDVVVERRGDGEIILRQR